MDTLGVIFVVVVIAWAACVFRETETTQHNCKKLKRVTRVFRGDRCAWCGEVVK